MLSILYIISIKFRFRAKKIKQKSIDTSLDLHVSNSLIVDVYLCFIALNREQNMRLLKLNYFYLCFTVNITHFRHHFIFEHDELPSFTSFRFAIKMQFQWTAFHSLLKRLHNPKTHMRFA